MKSIWKFFQQSFHCFLFGLVCLHSVVFIGHAAQIRLMSQRETSAENPASPATSDSARLSRLTVPSRIHTSQPHLRRKLRLPEAIAGYHGTILPILSADGTRLYFDRKWHPENTAGEADFDEIWYADKTLDTSPEAGFGKPIHLGAPLNTRGSDVLCSLSPDGASALVYGQYDTATAGVKQPGFSIARLVAGVWQAPEPIEIERYYNRAKKYFAHLAPDNRTLLLALEREDSRGGLDLYVSFRRDTSLVWTEPMNLGTTINTDKYEGSPCLAADGKTLYFSSEGHGGYGAADVFMAHRLDDSWKNWSTPINLGDGINAGEEDSSINLLLNGAGFYYVSSGANVGTNVATPDTTQSKGLYFADMPDSLRPLPALALTGLVTAKNINPELLRNAIVTVAAYRVSPAATDVVANSLSSVQVRDSIVRPKLRLESLSQIPYVPDRTRYTLALPAGEVYLVRASLALPRQQATLALGSELRLTSPFVQLGTRIGTDFEERIQNFTLAVPSWPQTIALVNDYEQNRSELINEHADRMNAALAATLTALEELQHIPATDRAKIRIDIMGHSCDIGSSVSNDALSLRRAEVIASALEAYGVPRTQMRVVGIGERKPLIRATSEDARRQNRRVEIIVTKE